jgi:hypothetical protein
MSRLTGSDALELFEAYQAVYAPQELTEEQVWEGVEEWVNSLLEEGYDLSDYTWEEMYGGYLEEILGMPSAQNTGAALRQGFGQSRRAVGGAISDVAGSAARGAMGQTTTSKNPISQAYNAVARGVTAAPRAAASFAGGVLSGKPATTQAAKPAPSAPAATKSAASASTPAARPAAAAAGSPPSRPAAASGPVLSKKGGVEGTGVGANFKAKAFTDAEKSRYSSAATQNAARSSTSAAPKPSAMDQFAKANPKLAASAAERDRTRGTSATTNPLMKDMKSRLPAPKTPSPTTANTAFSSSTPALGTSTPAMQSAGTAAASKPTTTGVSGFKMSTNLSTPAPKPAPTTKPTPAATGSKKPGSIVSGFDMFDVVKGYLIGEGYADTEESALVIMANMSEEWRQSIVEGDALRNTIKYLEGKRDAMNANKSGSANTAAPGKQSVGAAAYKAYQRLRLDGV